MCLVFCGDYIIPYIGSVLLFYFGFSIKKFGFLGVRSLSKLFISDHLNDFDYLSKSETHLRKLSENIDSKCDQIVVKLYK